MDIFELVKDVFQFLFDCVVYAVQHDSAAQAKLAEIAKDLGVTDEEAKK